MQKEKNEMLSNLRINIPLANSSTNKYNPISGLKTTSSIKYSRTSLVVAVVLDTDTVKAHLEYYYISSLN